MFEGETLHSYKMSNLFPPFARSMVRPDFSSSMEKLTKPPRPLMEEIERGLLPCYREYIKQAYNYDDYEEHYFEVIMNINQFKPSDVVVKEEDQYIVIEAKHELKPDPHGYVSRRFTRRVRIPDDVLITTLRCVFTKNGLLVIKASRKSPPRPKDDGIIEIKLQTPADFIDDEEIQEELLEYADGVNHTVPRKLE